MADKGKGIADDDYSSAKRKYNRKRIKPNFEDSDSSDDEVFNNVEDSSDDEDFIEDISNSRKTCSANKGNEVNKPKRGRPRKSQTNIDSTASPASDSASPASNKRGRPKKSQPNNASTPSAASDSASPATSKKGKVKLGEKKDKNTIRTRTSPNVLYKVMKKLTLGQRKDLIDMGFGSLYDMAVKDLPGRIGLFVVKNLVPEEMKIKIKLKNYDIQISPDLIHEMLGVPIGGLDIKNLVKNKKRKKYSISETWYGKFPKTIPTPSQVARFIKETQVEGIMFKLSILVLFSNVLGLAGQGGRCRPQQILDYITEETKIENIDWCKYVFDCLKVSKKKWNKDNPDSHYTGPLVALILIYIHSTKCVTDSIPHEVPAINYWSSEKIRERDNFEFDNGGFGNLDLYEKDNNDKDSSENKLDMDKLHQNVDLLEKILSDIKNEFKLSSSKNPDNPRLKELKAKFNNCIRNEYLSGEDMMDKGERENDETMGFETENEDLDEEREKDEKIDGDPGTSKEKDFPDKEMDDTIEKNQNHTSVVQENKDVSENEEHVERNENSFENRQMDEQQTVGEQDSVMTECEDEVRVDIVEDSLGDTVEKENQPVEKANEKTAAAETFQDSNENKKAEAEVVETAENEEAVASVETAEKQTVGEQDSVISQCEDEVGVDIVGNSLGDTVEKDNKPVEQANEKTEAAEIIHDSNENKEAAPEVECPNSTKENKEVLASVHGKEVLVEVPEFTVKDVRQEDKDEVTIENVASSSNIGCSMDDDEDDSYDGPDRVSPYQYTLVNPNVHLSKDEQIVSRTLFAMTGPPWEFIFKSERGDFLFHFDMETITPNLDISTNVIDLWSQILNVLELYKEDDTLPSRYFFRISVIDPLYFIEKHTDEEKLEAFTKRVDQSFRDDDEKHLKSLETFEMLFFPVCRESHLYLLCADFKNGSFSVIDSSSKGTDFEERYKSVPEEIKKVLVAYLDQVKHSKTERIRNTKPIRMQMKWRTKNNHVDCGVFLMLHMESYHGLNKWDCGLNMESERQTKQLHLLRSRYAAKIILSDLNLIKNKFLKLVQVFEKNSEDEMKEMTCYAIAHRKERERS